MDDVMFVHNGQEEATPQSLNRDFSPWLIVTLTHREAAPDSGLSLISTIALSKSSCMVNINKSTKKTMVHCRLRPRRPLHDGLV